MSIVSFKVSGIEESVKRRATVDDEPFFRVPVLQWNGTLIVISVSLTVCPFAFDEGLSARKTLILHVFFFLHV